MSGLDETLGPSPDLAYYATQSWDAVCHLKGQEIHFLDTSVSSLHSLLFTSPSPSSGKGHTDPGCPFDEIFLRAFSLSPTFSPSEKPPTPKVINIHPLCCLLPVHSGCRRCRRFFLAASGRRPAYNGRRLTQCTLLSLWVQNMCASIGRQFPFLMNPSHTDISMPRRHTPDSEPDSPRPASLQVPRISSSGA